MKLLYALFFFCFGALVVLGVLFLGGTDEPSSQLDPVSLDAQPPDDPRIDRLEQELEQLTRVVDRLRFELSEGGGTTRNEAVTPLSVTTGEEQRDAAWYLDQYVASFRNGGEGSEYFRLAVEAYLPSLLSEVRDIVASRGSNIILRRKLVEMLGDARFRENP